MLTWISGSETNLLKLNNEFLWGLFITNYLNDLELFKKVGKDELTDLFLKN